MQAFSCDGMRKNCFVLVFRAEKSLKGNFRFVFSTYTNGDGFSSLDDFFGRTTREQMEKGNISKTSDVLWGDKQFLIEIDTSNGVSLVLKVEKRLMMLNFS